MINPGFMAALSGFYPSLCTMRTATETQTSTGAVQQVWADAPGLAGLRCRLAPAANSANREVRAEAGTYGEFTYTIALGGYYPTITEKMQALVDGVAYDVQAAAHDGNHATTELFVRLAR